MLLAASGFFFIFSPGLPMSLLLRGGRGPAIDRGSLYWGIGVGLIAVVPSLFLQSLLRQIVQADVAPRALAGQPSDYALTLVAALITASFVAGGIYLVLRLRRRAAPADGLLPNGLALGFGVGLIAQVFTGLSLVGAGFRLMFGDASNPTMVSLGQISLLGLLIGLLPLILFRPALLVVSAARGVLVARSLVDGPRFFWLAVLVDAAFVWGVVALQLALGGENAGQVLVGDFEPWISAALVIYYLLAFGLAYRWLAARIAAWTPSEEVREA